jgi:molecular chaperone HscB
MASNKQKYSYFDLLEMETSPSIDLVVLERNYLTMQSKYHPDRFEDKKQKLLANNISQEINKAFTTLKDELTRRIYLLSLQSINVVDEKNKFKASPEILSKIFNIRLAAENANNITELEEFKLSAKNAFNEMIRNFDELYSLNKKMDCGQALVAAIYYQKILNELNNKRVM